ncbi:hypothetical protein [Alicyclobacillus vulcanalis]|nr:hypothetical protein [Alicyclobacillus vulcanalis]
MAIFGMTYAVLAIAAELRLYPRAAGWVHLVIAELGIVLLVAGSAMSNMLLTRVGAVAQAASPVLFLANILLAVRAKRKGRVQPPVIPEHLRYLGRRADCQRTDRVARRGTDLSGLLLMISAIWGCWGIWSDGDSSPGANALFYNGWLVGTVVSVSLHLYPRLLSGVRLSAWPIVLFQIIWLPATVALSVGTAFHINMLAGVGRDVLGAGLVGVAVVFEAALVRRSPGRCGTGSVESSSVTRVAWILGYVFAGVAGGWMIAGRESDALPVLHALFLGWMTTLVYGTSYAVMPVLFGIKIRSTTLSIAQMSMSAIGTALMMWGFADLDTMVGRILLATGGGLAWFAFAWYLVRIGWSGIHILRRMSTRAA